VRSASDRRTYKLNTTGVEVTDSQQESEVQFSLEKLYIKDVSFEAPNAPGVFLEQTESKVDVSMDLNHRKIDEEQGIFEAVLHLTVSAAHEDRSIFLVEVQQAGLFRIKGVPDDQMLPVLEISCPNILLPYAREVISSLVGHGGFPPLLVNPINFEALFQQRYAQESA
jgi:preprotein translocase subunit SecB